MTVLKRNPVYKLHEVVFVLTPTSPIEAAATAKEYSTTGVDLEI